MKFTTGKILAVTAVAATLLAASCGGNTTPVETFAEAADPVAADSTAWDGVKKGLNAMWGSTDRLYGRSVPPSEQGPKSIRLTAWRGERVSAQAVLWSASGAAGIVCTAGDFTSDAATLPASIATARFVRYTIADKSDPKCICPRPKDHPAVLQPDMLDSLSRFDMAARTTRPVWITVNVPADAPAGIYRSHITVTRADGWGKIRLPFELEVQDHTLPAASEWQYHLDLWQHPAAVARAEGVELWSDAHFDALRRTMQPLAAAGQKVITATLNKDPWNHQCYDAYDDMILWTLNADGTWSYDYKVFDRWVELMLSLGIDGMINCYSMVPWNNELVYTDKAKGEKVTVKAEPGTPEFERMWTPFLKDFKSHLAAKGWLEKIQHSHGRALTRGDGRRREGTREVRPRDGLRPGRQPRLVQALHDDARRLHLAAAGSRPRRPRQAPRGGLLNHVLRMLRTPLPQHVHLLEPLGDRAADVVRSGRGLRRHAALGI